MTHDDALTVRDFLDWRPLTAIACATIVAVSTAAYLYRGFDDKATAHLQQITQIQSVLAEGERAFTHDDNLDGQTLQLLTQARLATETASLNTANEQLRNTLTASTRIIEHALRTIETGGTLDLMDIEAYTLQAAKIEDLAFDTYPYAEPDFGQYMWFTAMSLFFVVLGFILVAILMKELIKHVWDWP